MERQQGARQEVQEVKEQVQDRNGMINGDSGMTQRKDGSGKRKKVKVLARETTRKLDKWAKAK